MRPTILHVGGTLYWTIQTYDPDKPGVLKDADSTPSVAVRKNGASSADSVTITKRSATTGLYDCSYNPAAEVEGDTFQLEETATVTGTTTSSATYTNQFSVRAVHAGAVELDPAALDPVLEAIAALETASATWTDAEKAQIRYRLGLDGTATAPAEPDVDPIVITPATGIMTTGYLVTRVKGVPTAGITIRYQQAQEPAADRGSSYDDTVYSATSNSEGIAELSLVKGGLYYVWRSAASRPMNVAAYRVLKADGTAPDATLALPSHVGA